MRSELRAKKDVICVVKCPHYLRSDDGESGWDIHSQAIETGDVLYLLGETKTFYYSDETPDKEMCHKVLTSKGMVGWSPEGYLRFNP